MSYGIVHPPCLIRSCLRFSIITVNTLVTRWCQNLVLGWWRSPPLQMFPLVNHMNTTTSQFVKKVNCWIVPFVLSWPLHLPSSSTLTYTSSPKHTHTYTLRHTPTTPYVSGWQGERHIKGWGTLEVEQKKHQWFPNLVTSFPPTALHFLHLSSLDLWL